MCLKVGTKTLPWFLGDRAKLVFVLMWLKAPGVFGGSVLSHFQGETQLAASSFGGWSICGNAVAHLFFLPVNLVVQLNMFIIVIEGQVQVPFLNPEMLLPVVDWC